MERPGPFLASRLQVKKEGMPKSFEPSDDALNIANSHRRQSFSSIIIVEAYVSRSSDAPEQALEAEQLRR